MEKKYLAFNTEFKADGEEGVIEGYAAYFNNVDSYNDVILQGAFKNITDVSDVKLFYNHEWNTVPIGTVMQLYEDDKGLKFQAKFNQTTLADDVKEAIKTGGITKMSIGYSVKDSEFNRDTGIRYIKDINLYEISPVNFPANDMAAIQSYKSKEFYKKNQELGEKLLKGIGKIEGLEQSIKEALETIVKIKENEIFNKETKTDAEQLMAALNNLK